MKKRKLRMRCPICKRAHLDHALCEAWAAKGEALKNHLLAQKAMKMIELLRTNRETLRVKRRAEREAMYARIFGPGEL